MPAPPVVDAPTASASLQVEHRGFGCHAIAGGMLAIAVGDGPPAPERLAAGNCGWVLVAPDLPTLAHRIDLLLQALPHLEATRVALERHELDRARDGLRALRPLANALRPLLIDAYLHAPKVACVQIALGIVCLGAGRHGEGLFHLLRVTPGQLEWFAVCRRYHLFRPSPAACRQLVATASAAELVGRHDEAELLQQTLRMAVRMMRVATVCDRLHGDLLWTRPDVLVHVRGVLEVGTAADVVAVLPSLGIHRVIAFAATAQQHAELVAAGRRAIDPATNWSLVPPTATGATPALDLDGWFAAGAFRATDCNLLRIGSEVPTHAILRCARATLRGIDFVIAVEPAPSGPDLPPALGQLPDESTVTGLLTMQGFVAMAATEAGELPRQVLYARAEHV
ncbi:MAG: hypothetical protein MUC36_13005 [Planctomycetes bacterium]|nr:hypothetical protein [Planctomycetota bacterium]